MNTLDLPRPIVVGWGPRPSLLRSVAYAKAADKTEFLRSRALDGPSGELLAELCGVAREGYALWRSRFEIMNLLDCDPEELSSERIIYNRAADVVGTAIARGPSHPPLILLGRKVEVAFYGVGRHEILRWYDKPVHRRFPRLDEAQPLLFRSLRVAFCPHPSGRNRWWNAPANRARARAFWAGVWRDICGPVDDAAEAH